MSICDIGVVADVWPSRCGNFRLYISNGSLYLFGPPHKAHTDQGDVSELRKCKDSMPHDELCLKSTRCPRAQMLCLSSHTIYIGEKEPYDSQRDEMRGTWRRQSPRRHHGKRRQCHISALTVTVTVRGTLLDSLFHTIESACIWMTRRLLERVKPTVVHISICRAARSSSARLEVVLARCRQAGDSFRFRHAFNVCVPLPETTKLIPVTTPLKLESL